MANRFSLTAALLPVAMLACSSSSPTTPEPPVELQPQRAAQTDRVGTFAAGDQQRFVTVDLVLVNRSSAVLPLAFSSFSIRQGDDAAFAGHKATIGHLKGCDNIGMLTAGATTRCTVVFQAPADAVPIKVVYKATDGVEYQAPISVLACESCGERCTDVQWDPDHCGACGKNVGLGTCEEGKLSCKSDAVECAGTCVDPQTDPAHCGSCGTAVGTSSICVAGKLEPCMAPTNLSCDNTCVDPYNDSANCKTCGRVCAKGACSKGLCCETVESKERVNCATVCGARACETIGATYKSSDGTKIVLMGVGTCNDIPHEKDSSDGTDVFFAEIECSCCE